jgi:alpha-tubulin suppressor-like RCC1 family protein
MCWGLGKNGRLGYGSGANVGDDEDPAAAGFVNLGAGMKAVQVAAGYGHNCVLTDAGEVKCWGQGASGRLGYGATVDVGLNEVPANVGFVPLGRNLRAVQVALGLSQTCVVTNDGTVKCWGANGGGELGIGNTNDVGDDETPAEAPCVNLGAGVKVAQISLGVGHACVLTTAGAVKCWGNAAAGQLGYGNTNNVGSAVIPANVGFVELGVSTTVTQVGAGDEYTCARTSDGKVKCWGSGEAGRLGYQSITNIGDDELPSTAGFVDIGTATTAQQLAVGNKSNCAVIAAGQAVCWGYGLSGQLGHGNTNDIGDDETPGSVGPIVFDE